MTVLVAFNCQDGVVIAADSMMTPSVGNIAVGHHSGKKISLLAGNQIYALAGDHGQNSRVAFCTESLHASIDGRQHPLDHPLSITVNIIDQFKKTGINNAINAAPILAFPHQGNHFCCVFEGALQPRLLDSHHFYAASGSGKLSADPFLRFLVDIFTPNGPPTLREAVFLSVWVVQHVIDVNPGGVSGPIRLATLALGSSGTYEAKEIPDSEIDEHKQAIKSACDALRSWRIAIQSGELAEGLPVQPTAPPT